MWLIKNGFNLYFCEDWFVRVAKSNGSWERKIGEGGDKNRGGGVLCICERVCVVGVSCVCVFVMFSGVIGCMCICMCDYNCMCLWAWFCVCVSKCMCV